MGAAARGGAGDGEEEGNVATSTRGVPMQRRRQQGSRRRLAGISDGTREEISQAAVRWRRSGIREGRDVEFLGRVVYFIEMNTRYSRASVTEDNRKIWSGAAKVGG